MHDLRRCPFCGNQCACATRPAMSSMWVVVCGKCDAQGPKGPTQEDAVMLWTERWVVVKNTADEW